MHKKDENSAIIIVKKQGIFRLKKEKKSIKNQ